jgi:hypothetical protein
MHFSCVEGLLIGTKMSESGDGMDLTIAQRGHCGRAENDDADSSISDLRRSYARHLARAGNF